MTRANARDTKAALTIADLNTEIDAEPRVLDVLLGERLGFARPRKIRDIVARNLVELETYGSSAPRRGAYRGKDFTEYYLNEPQALLICMFSNTSRAAEVRKMLIDVFMEYRRGKMEKPVSVQAHERRTSTRVDDAIRLKKNIDRLERATADIQEIADARQPRYLSAMVIDGEPVVVDVSDFDIRLGERAVVVGWSGHLAVEAVSPGETGARSFGARSAFGPSYKGSDGSIYRDGVVIIGKVLERRGPEKSAPAPALPVRYRGRKTLFRDQILQLVDTGKTNREIARETGATYQTVTHWRRWKQDRAA